MTRIFGLFGLVATALLLVSLIVPPQVHATCSCMMFRRPPPSTVAQSQGIASDPAYNPTSAVFLVRDGTKTILTMETAYQGPSKEVTLLIPVPQVVARDQVRTIAGSVFRNLDRRTAPTVKHVWPACRRVRRPRPMARAASADGFGGGGGGSRIEAIEQEYSIDVVDEWEVQEYDITLLGAEQSTGLLRYLTEQANLELPPSADAVLRSYIESDFRFVLAKVDPARAHRLGDRMMLSPIQIEYDSDQLQVPVRLGTLNSPGEQELLLYVLAKDGRYELANRPNVTAPSELQLEESAAGNVAELYNSLMNETFRRTPGAAVTEYAHNLGSKVGRFHVQSFGIPSDREARRVEEAGGRRGRWTLTRIRHRYGKDLDSDLILRPASSPLRMTRRWSHPELRVWAPRGESGFHVQFAVVHGGSCPSTQRQQRLAQQFATAESMWEGERDFWPGDVLLDDVTSLGITAQSSAPAGWPPPAVAPREVEIEKPDDEVAVPTGPISMSEMQAGSGTGLSAEEVRALQNQGAPAAAPAADSGGCGGCATIEGAPAAPALGLLFLTWVATRRKRS